MIRLSAICETPFNALAVLLAIRLPKHAELPAGPYTIAFRLCTYDCVRWTSQAALVSSDGFFTSRQIAG